MVNLYQTQTGFKSLAQIVLEICKKTVCIARVYRKIFLAPDRKPCFLVCSIVISWSIRLDYYTKIASEALRNQALL